MLERVLVFPTSLLNSLGTFHGWSDRVGHYLPAILEASNLSYLDRDLAEQDLRFKQLVPYAVLRCGDQVFCYRRGERGGEARLRRLFSLGVGGHICDLDGSLGESAYRAGYRRELDEEVEIGCPYADSIIGLVHDDQTPVGAVHFGVIHVVELERPEARPCDVALVEAGFRSIDDIANSRDEFESWSQFVVDNYLYRGSCQSGR